MTVAMTTDATPRVLKNWHEIDWKRVYRNVWRLQVRIVKAVFHCRLMKRGSERLEPYTGKLVSAVLRGLGHGNVASATRLRPQCCMYVYVEQQEMRRHLLFCQ